MAYVSHIDFVCELPGTGDLYREELDTGGFIYYSDESGELTEIWNTDTTSRASLLLALAGDEVRLHNVLREILNGND